MDPKQIKTNFDQPEGQEAFASTQAQTDQSVLSDAPTVNMDQFSFSREEQKHEPIQLLQRDFEDKISITKPPRIEKSQMSEMSGQTVIADSRESEYRSWDHEFNSRGVADQSQSEEIREEKPYNIGGSHLVHLVFNEKWEDSAIDHSRHIIENCKGLFLNGVSVSIIHKFENTYFEGHIINQLKSSEESMVKHQVYLEAHAGEPEKQTIDAFYIRVMYSVGQSLEAALASQIPIDNPLLSTLFEKFGVEKVMSRLFFCIDIMPGQAVVEEQRAKRCIQNHLKQFIPKQLWGMEFNINLIQDGFYLESQVYALNNRKPFDNNFQEYLIVVLEACSNSPHGKLHCKIDEDEI
ncbi:hypothetical protein FGO68_gene8106 [Halteria grandinella]|uniref:Uncharacterized protein n=1 Tax=Halteria grandinella TaxID=5974 RepID=A0A8J8NLK8_HALGN|nr:hypothetical protein FGO68_gene8106 [Halteria grandinella]